MSKRQAKPTPQKTLHDRLIYSEFGHEPKSLHSDQAPPAFSRAELPIAQQNLRLQASRKGRKGKTVTVISGFQGKPETLAELAKKLKAQCGAGGT
ncbi:MAG TPA: hypothetical protein V6D03_01880, partial [Candidatus Caenarcaniphilales bacterium]